VAEAIAVMEQAASVQRPALGEPVKTEEADKNEGGGN
jgi:hypothetical protein